MVPILPTLHTTPKPARTFPHLNSRFPDHSHAQTASRTWRQTFTALVIQQAAGLERVTLLFIPSLPVGAKSLSFFLFQDLDSKSTASLPPTKTTPRTHLVCLCNGNQRYYHGRCAKSSTKPPRKRFSSAGAEPLKERQAAPDAG